MGMAVFAGYGGVGGERKLGEVGETRFGLFFDRGC